MHRNAQLRQLQQVILQYASIAFRCGVVSIPILFIIPYLLGTYFQLVAITPLRLAHKQVEETQFVFQISYVMEETQTMRDGVECNHLVNENQQ